MTKKELLKKLEAVPEDMEIMLMQTDDESAYNMVNTAEIRPLTFGSADVPKREWATIDCFVITDEF